LEVVGKRKAGNLPMKYREKGAIQDGFLDDGVIRTCPVAQG